MPQQVYQTNPNQSADPFSSFVGGALAGARSIEDFRRKKKTEAMEDWRYSKERHDAGERDPGQRGHPGGGAPAGAPASINGGYPGGGLGGVPGAGVSLPNLQITPFNPDASAAPSPERASQSVPEPIPGGHLGSMRTPQNMPGALWQRIKQIGGRIGGTLRQMDDSLEPGIETTYSPEAPTATEAAANTQYGRELFMNQVASSAAMERQRAGDAAAMERTRLTDQGETVRAGMRRETDARNARSLEIQNDRLYQQNLMDQLQHYQSILTDEFGDYSDAERSEAQRMTIAIRRKLYELTIGKPNPGVSVGPMQPAP